MSVVPTVHIHAAAKVGEFVWLGVTSSVGRTSLQTLLSSGHVIL